MTSPADPELRILGIPGSLRRGSCSVAILETLSRRLAERHAARMTLFHLRDLPLYNSDLEAEACPAPVRSLRDAIKDAHGIVLCSPEYNHGVSGVLKNALDWASRPALQSPLRDKLVLSISSSPGVTGGVRVHHQLRETLFSTLSRVIPPEVVITSVYEKMIGGVFADESNLRYADQALDGLIAQARLVR